MSKLGRLAVAVLSAVAWLRVETAAQAPGRIQGVVTDQQGEPLPACTVEVTASSTGRRTAITDTAGRFEIVSLPEGSYRLSFSRSGFQTSVRDAVVLKAGQVLRIDVVLAVGGREEKVEVVAKPSYTVPNATTATKTETPLIDTPASIQVVPQQVLRDQQSTRLDQAVTNVSGVYRTSRFFLGANADDFVLRGFNTSEAVYQDGIRIDTGAIGMRDLANIEQVEVLKGPASILYGRIEPGGMVNYVTKKPLAIPAYSVDQQIGSWNMLRTTVDATGPLTADRKLAYRLDVAYENGDSFRQFVGNERWLVAPMIQWTPGPQTTLSFEFDYFNNQATTDNIGLVAFGNRPLDIPISRNLGEQTDYLDAHQSLYTLALTQVLDPHWTLNARVSGQTAHEEDGGSYGDYVTDESIVAGIVPRTIEGSLVGLSEVGDNSTFAGEVDLTGRFSTGSLQHTLLFGLDGRTNHWNTTCCGISGSALGDIDPFDPVHGVTLGPISDFPDIFYPPETSTSTENWWGLYAQDQVRIPGNVFVLLGLRYDNATARTSYSDIPNHDDKLSPRIGLLWNPTGFFSVYGSYSENFGAANLGQIDRQGNPLPPETAVQWEAGIKAETAGGRLAGSLAVYELTKENIEAPDPFYPPDDPVHGLAIGRARSKGVELDVRGSPAPGWEIVANYAYTWTEVLDDSFLGTAGNQMPNAPRNGGKLWTTYAWSSGSLAGLTVGGGLTARSQRQGDLANDYQLPGYATLDLMAGYSFKIGRTDLSAQLNVNNVLDRKYFDAGADYSRARIAPGPPRAFLGLLGVKL
ncbi:MAG TPA: TonB-dependent receptor [Thermoanaerobaculia bacterium]|nr:TonB-dependent receptor [Thermoanaerobaculia bacterium]